MVLEGFPPKKGVPVIFVHRARSLRCVVHGRSLTFPGLQEGLGWVAREIRGRKEGMA